jgi:hypothetical protein
VAARIAETAPNNRIHRLAPRAAVIRIAITAAAFDAICSTLPEDAPLWPVQRSCRTGRPRPTEGHARAAGELQRRDFAKSRWRERARGGGLPTLALSLPESNGSMEVKKQLSCRRYCGTVKLGRYFHTHDFE